MPIIGNVHQVIIPIVYTPAGHMPHSFQGSFAQQRTSEGNLHAVTAVDVFSQVVEARVVYKDVVHPVYESMEVSNLQRMKLASASSCSAWHMAFWHVL